MSTQRDLYEQLATRAQRLVSELPDEFLSILVEMLLQTSSAEMASTYLQVTEAIPNQAVQVQVNDLLRFWKANFRNLSNDSLALTLITAAKVETDCRTRQKTNLVWTGPTSPGLPLRRTDQALLQLIESARKHLLIVSFAVYKIERIVKALNRAARNGVAIDICLETPDASEGRITFDTIRNLGDDLVRQSKVYIWPLEQRHTTADGRHGSLHAKVAVADGKRLFISSANLTEYAMNLNMEMGVLIEGGLLPEQVQKHFEALKTNGILQQMI